MGTQGFRIWDLRFMVQDSGFRDLRLGVCRMLRQALVRDAKRAGGLCQVMQLTSGWQEMKE